MIKKNKKKHIIIDLIIVTTLIIIVGVIQSVVFNKKTKELLNASYENYNEIPEKYEGIISEKDFFDLTRETDYNEYSKYLDDYEIVENYELHYVHAAPFFNKIYVFCENTYKADIYRNGELLNESKELEDCPFRVCSFSKRHFTVIWEFKNFEWKVTEVRVHV